MFHLGKTDGDICGDIQSFEYEQRQYTKYPISYVLKEYSKYGEKDGRTMSYCDRHVALTPDGTLKGFKVYQYGAITNRYIDLSDHDMVFGDLEYHKMRILVVTFNIGDFKDKKPEYDQQNTWNHIVCSLKRAIETKKKVHGTNLIYFTLHSNVWRTILIYQR